MRNNRTIKKTTPIYSIIMIHIATGIKIEKINKRSLNGILKAYHNLLATKEKSKLQT